MRIEIEPGTHKATKISLNDLRIGEAAKHDSGTYYLRVEDCWLALNRDGKSGCRVLSNVVGISDYTRVPPATIIKLFTE